VNNQGEFGKWDFLVCRDLDLLLPELAKLLGMDPASTTQPAQASLRPGHLFG